MTIIAVVSAFIAVSCAGQTEEPLTLDGESTVLETNKSVSDLKENPNSVVYAYINNLTNKVKSYHSETNGYLNAQILFINYRVDFSSSLDRSGEYHYAKEDSHSTFVNVETESFYRKDKVAFTENMKDYKVYSMEDYKKVYYTPYQALITGYLFSDESILASSLVSEENGEYTFKYLLDNDKATPFVKGYMKETGSLVNYPTFNKIEMQITMKNDFTPVKIVVDAVYLAAKPIIGSGTCTQHVETLFNKVNEEVEVKNLEFYTSLLGQEAETMEINEEGDIKNDLLHSLDKLSWSEGVDVKGAIYSEIMSSSTDGGRINLNLDLSILADLNKLKDEDIFNFAKVKVNAEGDEWFSSITSIIMAIAGDKIGIDSKLFSAFRGLNFYYTGDANLYTVFYNSDKENYDLATTDIGNLLTFVLKRINIYNILTGDKEYVTFEKQEISADEYKVKLILEKERKKALVDTIQEFLDQQSMLSRILQYKSFDDLFIELTVRQEKISELHAYLSYINNNGNSVRLIGVDLTANKSEYDFEKTEEVFVQVDYKKQADEFTSKIKFYIDNIMFGETFNNRVDGILSEYENLPKEVKAYIREDDVDSFKELKNHSLNAIAIKEGIKKVNDLNYGEIYGLLERYKDLQYKYKDALAEYLGNDVEVIEKIDEYINYDDFKQAYESVPDTSKSVSEWGWSEEQMKDFKALFQIASNNQKVGEKLQEIVGDDDYTVVSFKILYSL